MHPHPHRHGPHGHPTIPDIPLDADAPLAHRVYHALHGVNRAQKQLLMRKLAEKDAHLGQAFAVRVLAHHEGMSPSELADTLNVARPTVTIMLKKMERAGLVERRPDERDQRGVRVFLTPAGRDMHASLKATHSEVVETTFGPLSEADLGELERLLGLVQRNLAGER